MDVINAPNPIPDSMPHPWLFLAGSIEMGAAEQWQKNIIDGLADTTGTIFNPRRSDWDSSWEQRAHNREFHTQVSWELMTMDMADYVFFNFCDGTQSPITLLELGICSVAKPKVTIVRATSGFWRFGNIEIVCEQAKSTIRIIYSIEDAIRYLESRLARKDDPSYIGPGPEPTRSPITDAKHPTAGATRRRGYN